jgi:hypothetical protein
MAGVLGAVPTTFLWVYPPSMGTIHHSDQPELPIVQQITCRRCRGAGEVYYARFPADVVGGKRIGCSECGGAGKLDLAEQLFRCDIVPVYKKPRGKRRPGHGSAEPLRPAAVAVGAPKSDRLMSITTALLLFELFGPVALISLDLAR